MRSMVELCCPHCRGRLAQENGQLRCAACNAVYPIVDGIPCFTAADTWYEGRFTATHPAVYRNIQNPIFKAFFKGFQVVSLTFRRDRFLILAIRRKKRLLEKSGHVVLDLGCGGGNQLLTQIGSVVGVDLSLASLKNAQKIYSAVIQCDATCLPFPDETFDMIVSFDVLGHIPAREKEQVFREMHRVLKKGGEMVHGIETDSENIFWRFGKRYPELFQRYFVEEIGGHFGLEFPRRALARFVDYGFTVLKAQMHYTLIWEPAGYLITFDNEYKTKSLVIRALVGASKVVNRFWLLKAAVSLLSGVATDFLNRFLDFDQATGILVHVRKD